MNKRIKEFFRPTAFAVATGTIYILVAVSLNVYNGFENPLPIATAFRASIAGLSGAVADMFFNR